MTCSAIICDWNGTLYEDIDEEFILRAIAIGLAKSYIPWHPFKFAHLIKTKNELETLNKKRNQSLDRDRIIVIFQVYNEKVIEGVSVSLLRRLVEKYSNERQVKNKIVYTALRPIAECHRVGTTTGILSAGYSYGIQMILKSAGYASSFDFYEANLLAETNGKALGFTLNIFKNKEEQLLRLLKDKDLDPKRTVYFGDSLDDAGCFGVVGHPIASFLTPEELKPRFAQKYKAFIPKNESELARYLRSI